MNRVLNTILVASLILALSSCSGNTSSAVQPDLSNPQARNGSDTALEGSQIWGLWDVELNAARDGFDAVPMRSAMFACNVIKFINKSSANLIIKVDSVESGPDYKIFGLNIGLRHPFPGLDIYTGFDVMGVFMGNGSAQYPGPEGFAIAGSGDQQLLNADGYTRRFNAPEFTGAGQIMPLQGYYPGNNATPGYTPTAVLNPYKYYVDGYDGSGNTFDFLAAHPEGRGAFRPGNVNYEYFRIKMPNQMRKFQYAILANWEPNIHHPQPPTSLDDFPQSANAEEAVAISVADSSDAYYVSETTYGGDIVMNITPWDWSASCSDAMEEYSIKVYSSAWTGAHPIDMHPTAQADHHYTFSATIPAETLTSSGDLPVWVEVDYPGHDYTSPVGVPNNASGTLASYFMTQVHILDHSPTPAGDNFVYGFADCEFFEYAASTDNLVLFGNMLNLPLKGAYAQNKKVMYYQGRTYHPSNVYADFAGFVQSLGYEWEQVIWNGDYDNPTMLDTTGVKMLMIATYITYDGITPFTPEEIQSIKDLLNGGGICVIVYENSQCYVPPYSTYLLDQVLAELKVDFTYPPLVLYETYPYTDFSPDPILQNVNGLSGAASGAWTVFGEGVSLVRGNDSFGGPYTTICKSPWRG